MNTMTIPYRFFLVSIIIACGLFFASSTYAATYTVVSTNDTISGSCGGSCSLRDAVIASNSHSGPDTIILPAGTYSLNNFTTAGEDLAASGDLDITDTSGTLTITGAGSGSTIIDGNDTDRIFDSKASTTVVISGVTITNGKVTDVDGGAIANYGTLTLSNSAVTNSTVQAYTIPEGAEYGDQFGAGIYCSGGTLNLDEVTVSGNYGDSNSGLFVTGVGIALGDYDSSCNATITDTSITNNTFNLFGSPAFGGGLSIYQSASTTVSVTDTTIADNISVGGGGVWIIGTTGVTAAEFNRVTVSNNRSYGEGGGFYLQGNAELMNTTIYGNQASIRGGGLHIANNTYSEALIYYTTITHNYSQVQGSTTSNGGGIYTAGTSAGVTIHGSIIVGNYRGAPSGSPVADDYYEPASNNDSLAYSIAGTASGNTFTTVLSSTVNPADISAITSATLADHGGTLQTVAIESDDVTDVLNSVACVDMDNNPLTVDARGLTRPENGNCDLGAHELDQTVPTVTKIGSDATVECTATYSDAGATASDNFGVAGSVTTTNPVNTNVPGAYTVAYAVDDYDGNSGGASRTVTVQDTTVPSIVLSGESSVTVTAGSTYTDAGATASDTCDTAMSVTTVNPVDVHTPGVYTVTYNASDDAGNAAVQVTRTVTVVAAMSTVSDHGKITSISKTQNRLQVTYADGEKQTVRPFGSSTNFRYALSTNKKRLVVTNGKEIRVFVNGTQVKKQKLNSTTYKSGQYAIAVKKIYNGYDTIIVTTAKGKTGYLYVTRLNTNNSISTLKNARIPIQNAGAFTVSSNSKRKEITVRFGSGKTTTSGTWKLSSNGSLKK